MKQSILCIVAAAFASLAPAASAAGPNIVLLLADDAGYGGFGFHGSRHFRTPNLDRLAERGVVCTSGYVPHPFCGPSRMGLFSGRYPYTFGAPYNLPPVALGIEQYNRQGIPQSEILISTVLRRAGYYTGAVSAIHRPRNSPGAPNRETGRLIGDCRRRDASRLGPARRRPPSSDYSNQGIVDDASKNTGRGLDPLRIGARNPFDLTGPPGCNNLCLAPRRRQPARHSTPAPMSQTHSPTPSMAEASPGESAITLWPPRAQALVIRC